MAMIKCPECGKEISNLANSCPNCGVPIRSYTQKSRGSSPVAKALKVLFGLGAIVLVIMGVAVHAGFFGILLFDLLAFGLVGLFGDR